MSKLNLKETTSTTSSNVSYYASFKLKGQRFKTAVQTKEEAKVWFEATLASLGVVDTTALSIEELIVNCTYYKDGSLYWLVDGTHPSIRKHNRVNEATNGVGYRVTFLKGKNYTSHRLIWLCVHGVWPQGTIDHINGVRTDNNISNLRDVPMGTNLKNKKKYKNNGTGHVGVRKIPSRKYGHVYQAIISYNKKCIYLGRTSSLEEAVALRQAAEIKYDFHKNHGR